jgi:hypothetical protein
MLCHGHNAAVPPIMNRLLRANIFFILLLSSAPVVLAQADFRYYVFDETKTDHLNLETEYDLAVYDFGDVEGCREGPRVLFWRRYRIYGVAQPTFAYKEELFDKHVSRPAYEAFLQEVRKEPLTRRDVDNLDVQESVTKLGWIKLDDHDFNVPGRRGNSDRERIHALIIAFYNQIAPEADRKITQRTIEGDLVPARPVSLKELLANPTAFDGKRVRVSGYYHREDHFSNLTFSKKSRMDTKQGIWINSASAFADTARIDHANNSYVTVEGTFVGQPGGNFDAWPAEIERITLITRR